MLSREIDYVCNAFSLGKFFDAEELVYAYDISEADHIAKSLLVVVVCGRVRGLAYGFDALCDLFFPAVQSVPQEPFGGLYKCRGCCNPLY